MPDSRKVAVWRSIALIGACLDAIGFGFIIADSLTNGEFEFIENRYDIYATVILLGTLILIVGLIFLFKNLDRHGRKVMGIAVSIVPIVTCVVGGAIVGTNAHGTFFGFVFPMVPVFVLGLVLLSIAVNSRSN